MRTCPGFERLAERRGDRGCTYYRRARPAGKPAECRWVNRRDQAELVRKGRSHAIRGFEGETPVGRCQYGTREELPRIDAGRNCKKVGPPGPGHPVEDHALLRRPGTSRPRGCEVRTEGRARVDQAAGRWDR